MSGLRKPAEIFGIAAVLASIVMSLAAWPPARAQQSPAVLFQNVRIFDGKNGALSPPSNVLVRNNKIEKISAAAITADAQVVSGGGRVLMPGLIDAHWHAMLVRPTPVSALNGDVGYNNLLAAAEATSTLMRGFTTIRDLGGPTFGLKQAIDEGLVAGPRIYPSGAVITITSGHGDFRQLSDLPRTIGGMLSRMEKLGASRVADSPDEVRLRAREQLMQGASQIKLTAGGGVASPFSPLDVSTFTEPELRAAVEAAENWGTYVAAHAYTPVSIQRSIAAGVKCIEHGHLMDDATARLMAEKGIWLSTQPFLDASAASGLGPAEQDSGKSTAQDKLLIRQLREDLAAAKEYLQSVIEDLESSNEELRAANVETLSVNEEFQSVNEELETAKEELQSANEELVTVNEQLQNRNVELASTSDDLSNLLAGVYIPIVMLDTERRIRRSAVRRRGWTLLR